MMFGCLKVLEFASEVLEKEGFLHVIRQPSPWSLTANFGERARDILASLAH